MKLRIEQIEPAKWLLLPGMVRRGKPYRRRETLFGSKKQAETRYLEILRELEAEAEEVERVADGSLTRFFTAIEYYQARRTINPRSETYFTRLKEEVGNIPIEEIKRPFEAFLFRLKAEGKKRGINKDGKKIITPISNGTVNAYLAYGKAILNLCVLHEVIQDNPLKTLKPLKVSARDSTLTLDERERLLSVIKTNAPHLWAIVNYSLQVPCRKGELVNAGRDNYSEVAGAIRIKNGTTKNDRGVWKPIPPDMVEYFKNIPKECPYLFYREVVSEAGERSYFPLGDFKTAWKSSLKTARIEDFRFHDLRHISATDMILAGNSERVVMNVAGWRTNMLQVYFHDDFSDIKNVAFRPKLSPSIDQKQEKAG